MASEQTMAIKAFFQAIGMTHWKMNFEMFCFKTGFQGEYAKEKWAEWQKLHKATTFFDPETLAKLLRE
jgi:hypothetical protein